MQKATKQGLSALPGTHQVNGFKEEVFDDEWATNLTYLKDFSAKNPSIQYLRMEWLDHNAISRVRLLHMNTAMEMISKRQSFGTSPVVAHLLSKNIGAPGLSATGDYNFYPDCSSLRPAAREKYATVRCEFRKGHGSAGQACPRSSLRRMEGIARERNLEFRVGFEIEVVFMNPTVIDGRVHYSKPINDIQGHVFASGRALQSERIFPAVESIIEALAASGVPVEHWHPEGAAGQWEIVLAPSSPLVAVDTLVAARDIISEIAVKHSLRATLYPKPYSDDYLGTGAHVHMSIDPLTDHTSFYAGVLKHLRAITAFTLPNPVSYERAVDFAYSGGTWIAWGTQNREVQVRRVDGSHYEIKCVDGLANMYHALAAIIGAGLRGISDREPLKLKDCPYEPARLTCGEREAYGITQRIPASISEALDSLQADEAMRSVMGEELVETYVSVKRAEAAMLEKMDPELRKDYLIERY